MKSVVPVVLRQALNRLCRSSCSKVVATPARRLRQFSSGSLHHTQSRRCTELARLHLHQSGRPDLPSAGHRAESWCFGASCRLASRRNTFWCACVRLPANTSWIDGFLVCKLGVPIDVHATLVPCSGQEAAIGAICNIATTPEQKLEVLSSLQIAMTDALSFCRLAFLYGARTIPLITGCGLGRLAAPC